MAATVPVVMVPVVPVLGLASSGRRDRPRVP